MIADTLRKRPPLRHALPAALAAALAVLAIDQLSKHIVVDQMNLREVGSIEVFPGLAFRMAWNTGVNFGIGSGGGNLVRWLLSAGTTLVACILLGASLSCKRMISAIGLGIAAGGALGNTIDRFTWGAVADFLNVSCCGIQNPWSFNIADIAVFGGFGLLLLPFGQPKQPPAAPTSAPGA
jgi:signal peptidase II